MYNKVLLEDVDKLNKHLGNIMSGDINLLAEEVQEEAKEGKEPNFAKLQVLLNKISFGKDKKQDVSKMEKEAQKLFDKIKKGELVSPNSISSIEKRMKKVLLKESEDGTIEEGLATDGPMNKLVKAGGSFKIEKTNHPKFKKGDIVYPLLRLGHHTFIDKLEGKGKSVGTIQKIDIKDGSVKLRSEIPDGSQYRIDLIKVVKESEGKTLDEAKGKSSQRGDGKVIKVQAGKADVEMIKPSGMSKDVKKGDILKGLPNDLKTIPNVGDIVHVGFGSKGLKITRNWTELGGHPTINESVDELDEAIGKATLSKNDGTIEKKVEMIGRFLKTLGLKRMAKEISPENLKQSSFAALREFRQKAVMYSPDKKTITITKRVVDKFEEALANFIVMGIFTKPEAVKFDKDMQKKAQTMMDKKTKEGWKTITESEDKISCKCGPNCKCDKNTNLEEASEEELIAKFKKQNPKMSDEDAKKMVAQIKEEELEEEVAADKTLLRRGDRIYYTLKGGESSFLRVNGHGAGGFEIRPKIDDGKLDAIAVLQKGKTSFSDLKKALKKAGWKVNKMKFSFNEPVNELKELKESVKPKSFITGSFVKKLIKEFKSGKHDKLMNKYKGTMEQMIADRLSDEVKHYWDSAIAEISDEKNRDEILAFLKTDQAVQAIKKQLGDMKESVDGESKFLLKDYVIEKESKFLLTEAVDISKLINDLINTNFSGSNEEQGKMVSLMKGLAFSDDPKANAFMKKLDSFMSSMKTDKTEEAEELEEAAPKMTSGYDGSPVLSKAFKSLKSVFNSLDNYAPNTDTKGDVKNALSYVKKAVSVLAIYKK